jgi:hypothetical protein
MLTTLIAAAMLTTCEVAFAFGVSRLLRRGLVDTSQP